MDGADLHGREIRAHQMDAFSKAHLCLKFFCMNGASLQKNKVIAKQFFFAKIAITSNRLLIPMNKTPRIHRAVVWIAYMAVAAISCLGSALALFPAVSHPART